MDSKSRKKLEDCVLRILEHGDPNKLTESKVRKLAADETGFDLSDTANRKLVKRVVEDFFVNRQENGPQVGKVSQVTAVSRISQAKRASPKPERRRKLISLDDEEEEEGEPEAHPKSNEVRESEEETEEKPANKGRVASSNPGRGQLKRIANESEESDRVDASDASVEDDGSRVAKKKRADRSADDQEEDRFPRKKPQWAAKTPRRLSSDEAGSDEEEDDGSRVAKKKRADRSADDQEEDRFPHKKPQWAAKTPRRLSSDEAGSDEEEERRAASSRKKNPPPVGNKQRLTGEDDKEEEQVVGHSKKRPDKKLFPAGDDPVLEISKTRFVAVQNFNGKQLVSIREYYEKDGKMLPGRKGISLTGEQWEVVKEGIPDIDAALRQLKRG